MITHEELGKILYEAIMAEAFRQTGLDLREKNKWENETDLVKSLWSAVAEAARDHIEGENAGWCGHE